MSTPTEHATWQLYETYHVPVNVQRDRRTYDHFASSHSRSMRQEQLLTTYMAEMIKAIRQDVHTHGDCWLLQAIVKHELPAIHLLDRSAIACVYAACFTPDEIAETDTRTIPYSTQCCATPGGMRYADRRARAYVIDLRSDAALQPLCHALLARAAQFQALKELQDILAQMRASHSVISELRDRSLEQNREIFRLQSELSTARLALTVAKNMLDAAAPVEEAIPATEDASADATPPEEAVAAEDTPAEAAPAQDDAPMLQ